MLNPDNESVAVSVVTILFVPADDDFSAVPIVGAVLSIFVTDKVAVAPACPELSTATAFIVALLVKLNPELYAVPLVLHDGAVPLVVYLIVL